MDKKYDVIGLGAYAVDLLGIIPSFPKPDTKNKMLKFAQQGGGPVATALVALARLGARVAFVGILGDDPFSNFAIAEFVKEGIDTSGIIRREGAGPLLALITVEEESGRRTILWTDQMVSHPTETELSKDLIASARILHLDEYGLPSALTAAPWAKEAGLKVVLDAENPERKELLPLIRLTDYLVVPEEFALGFSASRNSEEAGDFFLKIGPQAIIITEGEKGCFIKTEGKGLFQPAFKVKAVDTTGCGDVFHGGFIFGLLKEWPVEIAAEFASAVAALKCEKLGGRAGCPTLEQTKKFLASRGSEKMREFLTSP